MKNTPLQPLMVASPSAPDEMRADRAAAGSRPTKKRGVAKERTTTKTQWELRLYIAGHTPRSRTAIANLKKICDEYLPSNYQIEVIDLLENPALARGDQIVALPTLVRKLPVPMRKIIGDLSDTERVLVGLDLRPRRKGKAS